MYKAGPQGGAVGARKERKIGLFLFWTCNVKQSLERTVKRGMLERKKLYMNCIYSQWEFFFFFWLVISFGNSKCFFTKLSWLFICNFFFSFSFANLYQRLLSGSQLQRSILGLGVKKKTPLIFKHFPLEVRVPTPTRRLPQRTRDRLAFFFRPAYWSQAIRSCDPFAYFKLKCCLFCSDFL